MKMFFIGLVIGAILSIIVFGFISPIIVDKFLDTKTVGTINRVRDNDGITYMSAEFTEEGMKHMDTDHKVVFDIAPITNIAENSSPIMDTRKNHEWKE